MMKKAAIVFPNQLFEKPVCSEVDGVLLLEHARFFSAFAYHRKKLLFHRASMQAYAEKLRRRRIEVRYAAHQELLDAGGMAGYLQRQGVRELRVADPCDAALRGEIDEVAERLALRLEVVESPQFISDAESLKAFFAGRRHFSMASFYTAQRRRFAVLIENGKPVGGRWSFDRENRRALPAGLGIPPLPRPTRSRVVEEAQRYVARHFPNNPGSVEGFFYPVTHRGATAWLRDFLRRRLESFGPYEDAMSRDDPFLFHSVLSPLINAGLLTPEQVLRETLEHGRRHEVPINSLEGFVRQILGWREFMRAVYLLIGHEQRAANFWGFTNRLPSAFYTAGTGIEPVDTVIRRVMDNAYVHHIERLMVLGNFMLLCEIDPNDVRRWFMELFIDAYDWVMVPNVYGMSQYADGGRITTKPYISSSNYIRKMSDFPKGAWCDVWDALFWRFVHTHRQVFADNARMRVMAIQHDHMATEKRRGHIALAERYLATLFR